MKTLNKNTKKAKGFLKDRETAKMKGNYSIFSIYARPSSNKVEIARKIEKCFIDVVYHHGSCQCFICSGYDTKGNLIILTKDNTYKII